MSYNLNDKLKSFTPYEPICGEYRIRLDANESFIAPDAEILGKITGEIMQSQLNRYPDPYAKKVCALFADYCGIPSENVVAGNGSDEIISIIVSSFFEKNDKIMLFVPDFSMYGFYAQISELETVLCRKDEDMLIDVDAAIAKINAEGIKGVLLSNPCNPTSVGISSGEILRLAESTNALIVIDEAYMEFYGDSVIQSINKYDNLVVLKTCSKAFGLAGIRLGFALSNAKIINAIKAAKSPYNVNLLTQIAAAASLSDVDKIKRNIEEVIKSRDFLYDEIKKLSDSGGIITKVYPTCTNFVFIKSPESARIADVMRQNGIAVRHMGEHLRITAGTDFENRELLKTLSII